MSIPNPFVVCFDPVSSGSQSNPQRHDVTLEADVTTSATSNKTLGLTWRWSAGDNYYIAFLIPVDGLVKVSKVVSGSFTGLYQANITLLTSTTYRMKVVANGSSFKVYVNGTLYIDGTDSTFTTQTSHGIATNGSAGYSDLRWDNVQIGWIYSSQPMLDTTVYPNKYMEKNVTSNHTTLYYYFGGQMVALKKVGTLEYVSQDHLGSTSVTTDTSGAVTSRTRYKPFGEVLLTSNQETSGTLNTEHKFTGQIYDTGTNFYYYNARYYDRLIRRFTQADSLVPSVLNPQSLNRYSYLDNNPLNQTDPTGHCGIKDCFSGAVKAVKQSSYDNTVGAIKGAIALTKDPGSIRQLFSKEGAKAIISDYTNPNAGYRVGYAETDFLFFVGLAGLGKAGRLGKIAEEAAEAAEVTNKALRVAKAIDRVTEGGELLSSSEKTTQILKTGGFEQANKDFNQIVSQAGSNTPKPRGGGLRTGELVDGSDINVRPFSTMKDPTRATTLEIISPDGARIKIRYSD